MDREREKARAKSSRRGTTSRREARTSTSKRVKKPASAPEKGGDDPRAARGAREKDPGAKPPRTLDVIRSPGREAESGRPRRKETERPGRERAAESEAPPPPRETSKKAPRSETPSKSREREKEKEKEKEPKAGLGERRSSRRPGKGEEAESAATAGGARSKRAGLAGAGAGASRRSAAAAEPEKPGVLSLVGLVGATIQFLVGGTLTFAAAASPGFLRPAGFEVAEGAAKGIVIGFGALFLLSGLATELALFKYIRNAGRLDAAGAGGAAGAGSRRSSRRSPVDEEDLDDDLGDEDFDDE